MAHRCSPSYTCITVTCPLMRCMQQDLACDGAPVQPFSHLHRSHTSSHAPHATRLACAQVIIAVSGADGTPQTLSAFPSRLGVLPPDRQQPPLALKAAHPADACTALDPAQFQGASPDSSIEHTFSWAALVPRDMSTNWHCCTACSRCGEPPWQACLQTPSSGRNRAVCSP